MTTDSKVFGETYSGLGYDFKGLINLYEHSMNLEKMTEYLDIFYRWKEQREMMQDNYSIVLPEQTIKSIAEIKEQILHTSKWDTLNADTRILFYDFSHIFP